MTDKTTQPADLLAHVEVLRDIQNEYRAYNNAHHQVAALQAAIEFLAAHRVEVAAWLYEYEHDGEHDHCLSRERFFESWVINRQATETPLYTHPPQAQAGAGDAEELQFYRDECSIYRGKVDLLMAEVSQADEEGRAFIHKDTIVAIITHDPAVALEAKP